MRVNIALICVKPDQPKSNYIKHSFNKQLSSTDGHDTSYFCFPNWKTYKQSVMLFVSTPKRMKKLIIQYKPTKCMIF